jgi:hypothetical protein
MKVQQAIFVTLLLFGFNGFTQTGEKEPLKASANVQLTNNGVSLFPNLSLGKPAAIINVSLAKKRISFEPELRWGLNGKPWSYFFWMRYRYNSDKFSLRLGAHPSYVFGEQTVEINNQEVSRFITTRYAAGEISPGYRFSPKVNVNFHYLHAIGLDDYGVKSSNFYALQPQFTGLGVGKDYYFNFFPQIFYLELGDNAGSYVSETLTFNKKDFPIYLSHMMTYKLKSDIAGDDFVWSLGLNVKF